MPYVNVDQSLPRSLDVQISLSRAQTETRTNLSIACLVAPNLGFLPDATRIRFYSTLEGLLSDFDASTEVYKGASAFFAQTPRATTLAVGELFNTPQPARLVAQQLVAADMNTLKSVADGSLTIAVSPALGGAVVEHNITGLDFTGLTGTAGALAADLTAAAAVIQAKLTAGVVPATCGIQVFPGGSKNLVITSTATGDTALIVEATPEGSGTDVTALLNLTLATGAKALNGYTPGNIADELTNIKAAANANGSYLYGWCLAASLRNTDDQLIAAEWALGQVAIMPLVTNDLAALDAGITTDLGHQLKALGNRRVEAIYHNDASYYPDLSILAYMLSVNYALRDSTVTAKFKQLPGIPTVQLTESQWAALKAKGYNTYTFVGNNARTFREGTTSDTNYFLDSTINLDNFVEDLSVNVYNVFLRNKKVPYTRAGQMLLVDACTDTGNQYTYNGTFADREVQDLTSKSGIAILPAVAVNPTPISQASAADRAARIAPPIGIVAQEAGAIHSVAINVEVVN